MVVEDFADNRQYFTEVLELHGHEVIQAENGAEAVALAQRELPDVILMDLSLPVMDGWEATPRLKAGAGTSAIPVIALTAHALSGDQQRALAAGCDGYMAKPVLPRALLDCVDQHVRFSAS
jgi:two-component system cell cycle response regulator DivK